TETLVELVIDFARERSRSLAITIADIGTGSGVIAVSLAAELPNASLVATDESADALDLVRRNADRHEVGGRITLLQGDLLAPFFESVEIIAANLPYVRTT